LLDVNYSVTEKSSGNLSAGIGFSQTQGIVINANLSQDNVFGSGKRVSLAFNNSDYLTSYQFGFFNPYFTTDGINFSYNLGYTDRDASQVNISNYSTRTINAGLDLGIPLNEFDQIRTGLDFKYTKLKLADDSSDEINEFVYGEGGTQDNPTKNANGDIFFTIAPSIGWTHDTLNKAIFPTKGGQQRLSGLITLPGVSELECYKTSYKHQEYFPLSSYFTFRLQADIGYGGGYGETHGLPFFENYYGGGTGSVRGFKNNTLGPRDSNGDPFGGSTKIIGNAELFTPCRF
jgi:outer membrane protein insertion porin family